jgi:integrase
MWTRIQAVETPGSSESKLSISGHFVRKWEPKPIVIDASRDLLFEAKNILSDEYVEARLMPGKQAKVLSDHQLKYLLVFACNTRNPIRDKLIVLLSAKAGLRAGEIAKLAWDMVLDPSGEIGDVIELRDCVAKKRSGRLIPMHPSLRAGLTALRETTGGTGSVIRSERGEAMRPGSIVNWFAAAYQAVRLDGCSSHSGRRTFITRAARLVYRAGGSLRDVQLLAGHRSIQTTQRYIDGDTDAQRKLVSMI